MTTDTAIPDVGSAAPDADVLGAGGQPVHLSMLWRHKPVTIAFLGDPNSAFTADNAAQIRDGDESVEEVGGQVVAVFPGRPEQANGYLHQWRLDYELYSDPTGAFRDAWRVDGIATFVVDTTGVVRYAHRGAAPGDYPPIGDIVLATSALTGIEPPAPAVPQGDIPVDPSLVDALGAGKYASFTCPKCANDSCERYDIATAGGFVSRLVNMQHRKFTAVTCLGCGFTEFYRERTSLAGNVTDVLIGS
jgi:predicted nucleic-acid-binding Zn-ribbon protein/peroxiredoxin